MYSVYLILIFHRRESSQAEQFHLHRVCDPPGQKCVYIPPGDTAKEAYRLSTFLRFPSEIPVTPPDLAAAGFYYTGYKDRVKCFTCATSVESWTLGDKPIDVRWHKSNCSMVRGDECGNIRLGSGETTNFTPLNSYCTYKNLGGMLNLWEKNSLRWRNKLHQ